MSSREEILANIKANIDPKQIDLPQTNIPHVHFADKDAQFAKALKSVGGNAIWLENQNIDEFVLEHYPDAKVIASNCKDVTCNTKHPNKAKSPQSLKDVELAIIEGEFGVAENGAVWVKNPNDKYRALYFLAQQLLIIVKKDAIVDTMHEAYESIRFDDSCYGLFISGPSKTADIEQALVIGAHGPTEACVLFV